MASEFASLHYCHLDIFDPRLSPTNGVGQEAVVRCEINAATREAFKDPILEYEGMPPDGAEGVACASVDFF